MYMSSFMDSCVLLRKNAFPKLHSIGVADYQSVPLDRRTLARHEPLSLKGASPHSISS